MIKINDLSKTFGENQAVKEVNLQVERQAVFGLVGPDGAGKTTLIRMICGIVRPDGGRVEILGQEGHMHRELLGYMPQRFSLYGDLTVMENINFFGAMYRLKKDVISRRAGEILSLTNLVEFKNRFADNLSGGMKQKLALTCALVTRPGLLVLDEPTYGVDPESRKEFWKILYRLNKEGMTIVVSTPYMDEAELCTVVAFMDQGKIVAVDTPAELKKNFKYKVLEARVKTREPEIFQGVPGVLDTAFYGDKYRLIVKDIAAAREAMERRMAERKIDTGDMQLHQVTPSMEDVFVALAENEVV